jgi:peroxiredoxin
VTRQLDVLNYSRGNLAHPTTLVIDRAGTVRFAHIDYDYTNRPAAEDLLAVLKALKE